MKIWVCFTWTENWQRADLQGQWAIDPTFYGAKELAKGLRRRRGFEQHRIFHFFADVEKWYPEVQHAGLRLCIESFLKRKGQGVFVD